MSSEDETKTEHRRLTPAEWESCKLLWEYGNHTLSELAVKYGIRADTIQARLKKEGVEKGSRAHEAASLMAEAENEEVARQAAEMTKRIHSTKNDHYNWAEALGKLVMQEILDAKKGKTPIGLKNANITTLGKAAKTLEIIRKERYALLGLDTEMGDPDEIDELLVSELSDEQVRAMQAQMRGIGALTSDQEMDELTRFDEDDDGIVIEGE